MPSCLKLLILYLGLGLLAGAGTAAAVDPTSLNFTLTDTLGAFSSPRGYGYDFGTSPRAAGQPFFFSAAVPEGNFRVTVTFGDAASASDTTVKAESRRLMVEHVVTRPGEFVARTFIVNTRTTALPPPPANAPGGLSVVLNERETGSLTWDDKLTLEFDGAAPRVRTVELTRVSVPTVFIAGDSTVCDQRWEPGASWGQMLPRFFSPVVAIANHAESGETLKSFLSALRLAKILSLIKPGDYLFIQFGHNDEKQQWPQTYAEASTTYRAYLRTYIAEARLRGATPVLVTPMQRRTFDASGKIRNSHGEYPAVVREVAAAEHVSVIDLERMSTVFYEALGPEKSALAFGNGGKDPTHHDNYGAYELAKCVAQAIRGSHLPLAEWLSPDFTGFDPAHPDDPATFQMPASPPAGEVPPPRH